LILAQTGCDCKFNTEAQPCFCLFDPAPIAAARKCKPPALRMVVDFQAMAENPLAYPCFDSVSAFAPGFSTE
jgi:hypothetical protein